MLVPVWSASGFSRHVIFKALRSDIIHDFHIDWLTQRTVLMMYMQVNRES